MKRMVRTVATIAAAALFLVWGYVRFAPDQDEEWPALDATKSRIEQMRDACRDEPGAWSCRVILDD